MSEIQLTHGGIVRQADFIPEQEVNETHITCVGLGAIGSALMSVIPRLGFTSFSLIDFDRVEDINICLTSFGMGHIGSPKIEASTEIIQAVQPNAAIWAKDEPWTPDMGMEPFNPLDLKNKVVVSAADSMKARRELAETVPKLGENTLFLDGRMLGPYFEVYAFSGKPPLEDEDYPMFDDTDGNEGRCTGKGTTHTSYLCAGMMASIIVQWLNNKCGPLKYITHYDAGLRLDVTER